MIITKLKFDGLRGRKAEAALGPLTIVEGKNRAGKTTFADAIKWGVLGYIPGMDKPPRNWGELVTGEAGAHVTGEIESDGKKFVFGRVIGPNGKKLSGPTEPVSGINLLTLDAAQFLTATGPEQAAMLARAGGRIENWREIVGESLFKEIDLAHDDDWEDWQSWIEDALACAEDRQRQLKAERSMMEQTVRGLESLRQVVSVPADYAGQLKELQTKKAELNKQLGELQAKAPAHSTEIAEIKESLKAHYSTVSKLDIANLGGDIECHNFAKEQFAKLPAWTDEAVSELRAKLAHMRTVKEISAERGRIRQQYNESLSRITELDGLRAAKICPTCGAKGKSFDVKLKKMIAEASRITTRLSTERDEIETELKEREHIELQLDTAEEWIADRDRLARIDERLSHVAAARDLRHRLTVLEQATGEDDLEEDKYQIECKIEELDEEISRIQEEADIDKAYRSKLATLSEAEEKLKASEQVQNKWKLSVEHLRAVRETLISQSLRPILDTMKIFTAGLMEDLQFNGTELGRMALSWIPFRQFSGMEKMVATAALTCALGNNSGANIAVVDEMGLMDDESYSKFIQNVVIAMRTGELSQFIGLTIPRTNHSADLISRKAMTVISL